MFKKTSIIIIAVCFFINSVYATDSNSYRTLPTLGPDMVKSKGRAGRIFREELVPKYSALTVVITTMRLSAIALTRNGENPEIERKVRELNNKLASYGETLYYYIKQKHPGIKNRRNLEKALEKLEEEIAALGREISALMQQAANKNGQGTGHEISAGGKDDREMDYGTEAGAMGGTEYGDVEYLEPAPKSKCRINKDGTKVCLSTGAR